MEGAWYSSIMESSKRNIATSETKCHPPSTHTHHSRCPCDFRTHSPPPTLIPHHIHKGPTSSTHSHRLSSHVPPPHRPPDSPFPPSSSSPARSTPISSAKAQPHRRRPRRSRRGTGHSLLCRLRRWRRGGGSRSLCVGGGCMVGYCGGRRRPRGWER